LLENPAVQVQVDAEEFEAQARPATEPDEGLLAGWRFSTLTDQATSLFQRTCEWFSKTRQPCHLGGREFLIKEIRSTPTANWQQLALSQPARQLGLRFCSPTAFKQGSGHLPLPLPVNVSRSPVHIWEAFAPPMMHLPEGWLDWCNQDVFVKQHKIETVQVNLSQQERFTGFVGEVWFEAIQGNEINLCVWQALGTLATVCGVGHRTTRGMRAVERIS
jgi:CRISPR-associated endoribonuclease Cas6